MVFKSSLRAFPAHHQAQSLVALQLASIFKIHRKFQGFIVPLQKCKHVHKHTCVVHIYESMYDNLVNWWEELGVEESRLSGLQDAEVSRPHADVNAYFTL